MSRLENKSVLVIGGSSGIGYGVADKALAEGAKVHIASSNVSRLQESVANLQKKYPGASITGQVCDLKDPQVERNLETALESLKPLDHIVYTAGDALLIRSLDQIDLDTIHQAGHVRFFVPLLLAKYVQRTLRPGYQSSLTLTTGVGGEKPFPNWSLVAGYLTGLQGLVRNLALDLRPIRVNLVSPGVVETPLHGPDGMSEELKKYTMLGKVGTVEEVAEAYLYLMKDTNATGATISTNAGALLL